MFKPNLHILPAAQKKLWGELKHTPREFVLYGGTALALRLAHRHSEDFDFFANNSFVPEALRKAIPYLENAEMSQFETNTLTAIVDRGSPVKVSFFGGLTFNCVQEPEIAEDNRIQVASVLDIAATKLATIQQRAQARDYEDLAAVLNTGITLSEILAAASAVYGKEFNGALSLKALTYFSDGDLPNLGTGTQQKLRALAVEVNLKNIPLMKARTGLTAREVQR